MERRLRIGVFANPGGTQQFGLALASIYQAACEQQVELLVYGMRPDETGDPPVGESHVDGWIVVHRREGLERLLQTDKPAVLVNADVGDARRPTILPDNRTSARELVRHLIAHGHTRIAFLGNLIHRDAELRRDGYREALREAGIEPDPSLEFDLAPDEEPRLRAALAQLFGAEHACTAIFPCHDHNAVLAVRVLQKAGLRVPEDVAVVGFDDILLAAECTPPITTARQQFGEHGRLALELLLRMLRGDPDVPSRPMVPCDLVVRESCGCPPGDHAAPAGGESAAPRADMQTRYFYDSIFGGFETTLRDMVRRSAEGAETLGWLANTGEVWGCYAEFDPADPARQTLVVRASFATPGQPAVPVGMRLRAADFPPAAHLPERPIEGRRFLKLLAVRTEQREWGYLATCGVFEPQIYTSSLARLLGSVLDQRELLESVRAKQRELQHAFEREHMLSETVRELGCPVIPILPGVLLVPLIGGLDSARAQQLIDVVLHAVAQERASRVLLDITGVPIVDTHVAGALVQVAQASALLGAQLVLVGIRPEIAQSIVSLGVNLSALRTYASLSSAMQEILLQRR